MLDELRLPVEASAPRSARRWWRQHDGQLAGDAGDVVELLLTEVVTNVVVHARTPSTCRLAVQDDLVCVEVQDGSPSLPRRRRRRRGGRRVGPGRRAAGQLGRAVGGPAGDGRQGRLVLRRRDRLNRRPWP